MVTSEEFNLPRALLCTHSEYFRTALDAKWLEGQCRRLELDDVHPKLFRMFVGWLFFQTVFLDEDGVESHELQTGSEGDKSDTNAEAPIAQDNDTVEDNGDEVEVTDAHESLVSPDSNKLLPASTTVRLRCLKEGARADPMEPLTWHWVDLFELYVFADKYNTRGLRLQVFDIIQLKLMKASGKGTEVMNTPALPCSTAITYITDNLPKDSQMLRMVAREYRTRNPKWAQVNQEWLASLPASFLARLLWINMKLQCAMACKNCMSVYKESTRACNDHCRTDMVALMDIWPCEFHEHGEDDDEMSACSARWEARIDALAATAENASK